MPRDTPVVRAGHRADVPGCAGDAFAPGDLADIVRTGNEIRNGAPA